MYTLFPIVGFVTEIVQYGMLRYYLPQMGAFVLVTTVGRDLGWFPIQILLWIQQQETFNSDLAFLLFGLVIGGGQWLLRRHLLGARW